MKQKEEIIPSLNFTGQVVHSAVREDETKLQPISSLSFYFLNITAKSSANHSRSRNRRERERGEKEREREKGKGGGRGRENTRDNFPVLCFRARPAARLIFVDSETSDVDSAVVGSVECAYQANGTCELLQFPRGIPYATWPPASAVLCL